MPPDGHPHSHHGMLGGFGSARYCPGHSWSEIQINLLQSDFYRVVTVFIAYLTKGILKTAQRVQ